MIVAFQVSVAVVLIDRQILTTILDQHRRRQYACSFSVVVELDRLVKYSSCVHRSASVEETDLLSSITVSA
jgi:hypothetical protein